MFLEYNKLLVGPAFSNINLDVEAKLEFIDLKSESTICPPVADFPAKVASALAGLNYDNEPVICGGGDASKTSNPYCRRLTNGTWKSSPLLLTRGRAYGSTYFSPENYGDGRIFFVGGFYDQVIIELYLTSIIAAW